MNKKSLFDFLDKELEGLTLEKKVSDLQRVSEKCYIERYMNDLIKDYEKCPRCNKFFKKNQDIERVTKVEEFEDLLLNGPPHGVKSIFEITKYINTYKKCPLCSKLIHEHTKIEKRNVSA